jgi:hypothetical protein
MSSDACNHFREDSETTDGVLEVTHNPEDVSIPEEHVLTKSEP